MGRYPKGFQLGSKTTQKQASVVKPKKIHEISHVVDKNSKTIAKISQLLEISSKHGAQQNADDEAVIQQKIEKLRSRLNRRLIKLAKWSDIPQEERTSLEFRFHKLGTLKAFGPVEVIPMFAHAGFRGTATSNAQSSAKIVNNITSSAITNSSTTAVHTKTTGVGSLLPQTSLLPNPTLKAPPTANPLTNIIPNSGFSHLSHNTTNKVNDRPIFPSLTTSNSEMSTSGITSSTRFANTTNHNLISSINTASVALKNIINVTNPNNASTGQNNNNNMTNNYNSMQKPQQPSMSMSVPLSAFTQNQQYQQQQQLTQQHQQQSSNAVLLPISASSYAQNHSAMIQSTANNSTSNYPSQNLVTIPRQSSNNMNASNNINNGYSNAQQFQQQQQQQPMSMHNNNFSGIMGGVSYPNTYNGNNNNTSNNINTNNSLGFALPPPQNSPRNNSFISNSFPHQSSIPQQQQQSQQSLQQQNPYQQPLQQLPYRSHFGHPQQPQQPQSQSTSSVLPSPSSIIFNNTNNNHNSNH